MNLDPLLTLDPASGLVSDAMVHPPNDVELWRTVALLANCEADQPGFATTVGAFDISRRRSLIRGAGEAVERYALVPAPTDADHLCVPDDVEPVPADVPALPLPLLDCAPAAVPLVPLLLRLDCALEVLELLAVEFAGLPAFELPCEPVPVTWAMVRPPTASAPMATEMMRSLDRDMGFS